MRDSATEEKGWVTKLFDQAISEVKRVAGGAIQGAEVDVKLRAQGGSSASVKLGNRKPNYLLLAAIAAGAYVVLKHK